MRSVDDPNIYAVGECAQHRGQRLRPGGAAVGAGEGARRPHHRHTIRRAAYHGSKLATKLKVMGVELASMGIVEPPTTATKSVQFSEPKQGHLQEADHPRRPAGRRHPAGRYQQGRLSDAGLRPRHAAAGRAAVAAVRSRRADRKKVTFDEMPADTQVCNCNGVSKGAIGACVVGGKRSAKAVMDATRAGMGCGSCKALVANWSSGSAAATSRKIRRCTTTCRASR